MLSALSRRMNAQSLSHLSPPVFASEWLNIAYNHTTLQLYHTARTAPVSSTTLYAAANEHVADVRYSAAFVSPAVSHSTYPQSHTVMRSYAQAVQPAASMSSLTAQPHTVDIPSTISDLLQFWFKDLPKHSTDAPASQDVVKQVVTAWFSSSPEFDEQCKQKYLQLYKRLEHDTELEQQLMSHGEDGQLALIVLYDQLSRNLFRGSPEAFAKDRQAQQLSLSMINSGRIDRYSSWYATIIGMPLLHSEDIEHQRICLQQAEKRQDKQQMQSCHEHLNVVEKFGRMPHRNAVLGRESTAAEVAFLQSPEAPGWMKSQVKPADAQAKPGTPHATPTHSNQHHNVNSQPKHHSPSKSYNPHYRSNQSAEHQPLIVTLQLDPHAQQIMNDLRKQYFPPKRNFLEAHVTLFHALPAEHEDEIKQLLSQLAANTPIFDIVYDKPMLLGKGVALDAEKSKIGGLHRKMQHIWQPWLTPQDSQRLRQHVTIQNKVEPEEAKKLYEELKQTWQALHCKATGFELYRYVAPRWQFMQQFKFQPQQEAGT